MYDPDRHIATPAEITDYRNGNSIRALAANYHHAYGTQRLRLLMAGVELRGRGGGRRKVKPGQEPT